MGDDSILLWLSVEVAWGYFLAVTLGMMGALQLVAAHSPRDAWRWLPPRLAMPTGVLLILGAIGWFYAMHYRLIFVPGPAGLELMVLFGSGTIVAAWGTQGLAWVRRRAESGKQKAESGNT